MPKVSALPEDTNPTLDDYTYTLDSGATTAKKTLWSKVLTMLLTGIYPVGSVIINTTGANPATQGFGGTWTAFGSGRTLVGRDAAQAEFDTVEEVGGAKAVTLTTNEMPAHAHGVNDGGHSHGMNGAGAHNHSIGTLGTSGSYGIRDGAASSSGTGYTSSVGDHAHAIHASYAYISIANAGGGAAHNNLQPYIVVYFWKRTA